MTGKSKFSRYTLLSLFTIETYNLNCGKKKAKKRFIFYFLNMLACSWNISFLYVYVHNKAISPTFSYLGHFWMAVLLLSWPLVFSSLVTPSSLDLLSLFSPMDSPSLLFCSPSYYPFLLQRRFFFSTLSALLTLLFFGSPFRYLTPFFPFRYHPY